MVERLVTRRSCSLKGRQLMTVIERETYAKFVGLEN